MNICTYSKNDGGDYFEVLVHEYNHSFVNPLLENSSTNKKLIQSAGEWLLKFSESAMIYSAYGNWSTVINESIVRAGVVLYLIDNGYSSSKIKAQLEYEILQGFTWTPDLVMKLKYYTEHRDKYKTLNDFYPEIAKCLDEYVSEKRNAAESCLSSKEDFVKSNNTQVKVEVSETMELMSMISQLAGFGEYYPLSGKVDTWFDGYENHPLIIFYKQLRQNNGIGYEAVASMGMHLAIENGTLKYVSDRSLLGSRWNGVDLDEFLSKLNKFYTESRFHSYFTSQQSKYSKYVNAYKEKILPYFHEDWYNSFYGSESSTNYWVILTFCNRGNSYGASRINAEGKKDVMTVCQYYPDEDDNWYRENLIHEFNHSYVNPLLEDSNENQNLFSKVGDSLLTLSRTAMNSAKYSKGTTVINESIVRAAVIIYLQEKGFPLSQIKDRIFLDISKGFTWMPELVEALRYYTNHRDVYKTLNDFYPEIAKCLENYVTKEQAKIAQTATTNRDIFNTEINGFRFGFESNGDNPMTLTLVSTKCEDKNSTTASIPATVEGHQVTTIGERALRLQDNPYSRFSVIVPEGVVKISDEGLFWSYVNHISLPSTLKTIGAHAFYLTYLEELYIPASVERIGARFIHNIDCLEQIVVDEKNPIFDSRYNCNAVIETATNTLIHGCKTSTVPKGVTSIGSYAFSECRAMTSFEIPSWVTSIGDRAFRSCSNLKSVYSYNEQPITVPGDLFIDIPSDAILYVPTGTKKKYAAAQGWNAIKNIVEMDMTDIKDVLTSTNEQKSLFYNLQGQRVKNPGKGIYIHNGRKVLIK